MFAQFIFCTCFILFSLSDCKSLIKYYLLSSEWCLFNLRCLLLFIIWHFISQLSTFSFDNLGYLLMHINLKSLQILPISSLYFSSFCSYHVYVSPIVIFQPISLVYLLLSGLFLWFACYGSSPYNISPTFVSGYLLLQVEGTTFTYASFQNSLFCMHVLLSFAPCSLTP